MITNDPALCVPCWLVLWTTSHSSDSNHPTLSLSCHHSLHISVTHSHHLTPSPDSITHPVTRSHTWLLHVWSCVTPTEVTWHAWQCALPSSLQICLATAPVLQDEPSPWLLSPGLASSVSWPYARVNFMIHYIFHLQITPYMFRPPSLD